MWTGNSCWDAQQRLEVIMQILLKLHLKQREKNLYQKEVRFVITHFSIKLSPRVLKETILSFHIVEICFEQFYTLKSWIIQLEYNEIFAWNICNVVNVINFVVLWCSRVFVSLYKSYLYHRKTFLYNVEKIMRLGSTLPFSHLFLF